LTKAELLTAQRGAAGGYRLSRHAAAISIGDVIAAIEGPLALTACIDEREEDVCGVQSFCGMRGNWAVVNTAVSEALNRVTLADMAPAWMNMFGPLEALSQGIEPDDHITASTTAPTTASTTAPAAAPAAAAGLSPETEPTSKEAR
ncbi:MAG: Rrf2 family transcriptional regulator, partial [Pseudomonadota bacterium]|nr:Rrf2 family transcriptional regulator [Pseudomonadota bacterium]